MSQIDVNITFPQGKHQKPSVTNSTSQNNPISASQTYLEWKADSSEDNLELTGVTFYLTQAEKDAKRNPQTPAYLDTPGGHADNAIGRPDPTTWRINFNTNSLASEAVLIYTLHYKDDDFPDLAWDPKLTISPRG